MLLQAVGEGLVIALTCAWLSRRTYRRDIDRTELQHPKIFGLFLVFVGAAVGWLLPSSVTSIPALALTPLVAAVSWIDVDVRRIPNQVNLVAVGLQLLALLTAAALSGEWTRAGLALPWTLGVCGVFWLMNRLGSLGAGDVKFAPTIGLVLGWGGPVAVVRGLLAIAIIGAAFAIVLLARGRRRATVPYGAAMGAGALAAILSISQ